MKFEQGVKSKARRPLKKNEFRSINEQLRGANSIITKYGMPALIAFQFHLIGRVDDCCQTGEERSSTEILHPIIATHTTAGPRFQQRCCGKAIQKNGIGVW